MTGGAAAGMAYDFSIDAATRHPSSPARVAAMRMSRLAHSCWRCCRAACSAHAADYAREERWAQEVVPSLVVGDAV